MRGGKKQFGTEGLLKGKWLSTPGARVGALARAATRLVQKKKGRVKFAKGV